jgi:hypothetical protein
MTQADFPIRPIRLALHLTAIGLLLLASGCTGGGDRTTGDHAGQPNGKFTVTPAAATVIAGQTQQFSAVSPWGSGAVWSVLPATGGSFSANGTFTASSTAGQYQIVAMWNNDVRYTATASVSIVPPPLPAQINPNLVQAFGVRQASGSGTTRNTPVVGEAVPARTAATPSGTEQVRHGFDPPVNH